MLDSLFAADLCLLLNSVRGRWGWGEEGLLSLWVRKEIGLIFVSDCSIFGASIECKDWPLHATRNHSSWQPWMSVCVCMWEREREILAITSSPSSIPPPSLPLVEAAHAVRQHAALLQVSDFECRVEKRRLRTSTGNGRSACTGKPRRHWLFTEALRTIDSGGVSKRTKKNCLRFFKKSGKSILKKR